jgi:sec-independent protein translocase protein TatC
MADDPEPRGSRSGDDADAGADAPSESDVESTPASDSDPGSESDVEAEAGSEPDDESDPDTGDDRTTAAGDGSMDGESDTDDGTGEGADNDASGDADDGNGDADDVNAATNDVNAATDDPDDGVDGTDRFEHAVGDRDDEGMPKPTPPIDSGDVDVDGTEAATSSFEFGALPDEAASDAETSGFQFGSARDDDEASDSAASDGSDADTTTAGTAGAASGDTGAAALETPELDDRPTGDARDAPVTGSDVVGEEPAYDPSIASDDDGGVFDGPDSDVEMPLADHIEEMVRRLGIVFLIAGIVAVVVFPIADDLVNFLWNTHIPGATTIESRRPRLYGPLELILTEFKVAGLAGFVVGLPVFVYQTYRFMRPGLYPKERKYYLAAVPTSLILAFVGVSFAHFVVLPAIFAYFTSYTIGTAVIAFGLKETFGLILVLMGYMALVFQIPLFIMLAIMMNLVTRQWLSEKRLLFWGGFLGLSFLVSPDPTGMAPIIIAATMIVLFEGTLLLLKWVGR